MKKAFTLSEVLLTLAVIGIISAMTIPVFVDSYNRKVMGTQLRKTCTQITLAAREIISNEHSGDIIEDTDMEEEEDTEDETQNTEPGNPESSPEETSSDPASEENQTPEATQAKGGFYLSSAGVKTSDEKSGAQYFLNEYFTHLKTNCGSGGSYDCIATQYTNPSRTNLGSIPSNYYCIRTTNAASICMAYDTNDKLTRVVVDVNGKDNPNMTGVDTFVMYITNDGDLKDLDDNMENCNKSSFSGSTIFDYAAGCFTKIVSNGWEMPKD